VICGGRRAQLLERLADQPGQALDITDRVEPDRVVEDLRALADQVIAEQLHQPGDLVDRALPVLRRERVQRQRLDPELARRARDVADRVRPEPVALDARQPAPLGPATVAIHDDADVTRQSARLGGHRVSRPHGSPKHRQ